MKQKTHAQLAFVPFKWDGCNSFKARDRAAYDLREHLKRWFSQEGEAKHVIVAHSHGGTVAIAATANPNRPIVQTYSEDGSAVTNPLAGIITLATPFLVWRPHRRGARKVEFLPNLYLSSIFVKYLFPLSLATWWQFGHVAFVTSFLLLSMLSLTTLRTRRELFRDLMIGQPVEPKYPCPLIAIRAPRDEASMAIGLTLAFDFVARQLWRYALLVVGSLSFGVFGVAVIYSILGKQWYSIWESWLLVGLFFMFFWYLTYMITALLLAVAMGPEILDYSGFGDVQSEVLPPATSSFVDMLSLSDIEKEQFTHSLHEFPSTRASVAYWLEQVMKDSAVRM